MNITHLRRLARRRTAALGTAAVAVLAPLAVLWSGAPAGAVDTPPQTGCPAGYQTLSVSWLESQGPYMLPAILDDPANGGNDDGYVCGLPLPDAAAVQLCGGPCGVPVLYQFRDNNLTPRH